MSEKIPICPKCQRVIQGKVCNPCFTAQWWSAERMLYLARMDRLSKENERLRAALRSGEAAVLQEKIADLHRDQERDRAEFFIIAAAAADFRGMLRTLLEEGRLNKPEELGYRAILNTLRQCLHDHEKRYPMNNLHGLPLFASHNPP